MIRRRVELVIVGSGFAGLGMAVRLRQAGMTDFVVLERAGDVGGTWRDNTYPGAACDVPSHLYSFSFAPNPHWTRSFSAQPEIQGYLRRVAGDFGVSPHLRFRQEVTAARFDEATGRWLVDTPSARYDARFLVSAAGALSEPSIPPLPGLDTFRGTCFHSARWDHHHDLTGRRIAIVGTGASAIQFVPRIAPAAGRLYIFQRTPPWIVPRWDRALTRAERWLFRHLPPVQRLARTAIYWGREGYVLGFARDPRYLEVAARLARRHLERQVPDPVLRARLTPDYTIGCKRILISNDYLPALGRDNVELVTDPITEVRPDGIATGEGAPRPVDTIIFGTGFCVTDPPIASRIHGRDGRSLADHWDGGPVAHRGTTVPGFPNLFLLVGPNTGLGHTSQVFMIESQIAYVLAALRHVAATDGATLEVRPGAASAWTGRVQAAMDRTVWTTGGCASWYLDPSGRNTTLWPGFTFEFRRRLRHFDPAAYRFSVPARRPAPEAVSPR